MGGAILPLPALIFVAAMAIGAAIHGFVLPPHRRPEHVAGPEPAGDIVWPSSRSHRPFPLRRN